MKLSDKRIWFVLAGVLLIPALLINLGLQTINDDEAIRTIVAMEMDLSGNYIVPTWNGEFYRSKPPLYNWVLAVSFKVFGGFSQWSARIPNIGFLFLFGYVIYFFSKKHFSKEYSVLNALLFITCGRLLFWDSMLAYIDILYSLVTFTSFMVLFHAKEKERYWSLFIVSYLLCAAGFLLKGFPSLLFQALTLLVVFVGKDWKKLVSKEHIVGILIFSAIVGSYYLLYIQQADLDKTVNSLLDQATRRTAIHDQYSYGQLLSHIFTYPFENIYHFLPWSIMVIYLFKKGVLSTISSNKFLRFCGLTFLANIIVYWLSVEVYPRYILMLIPLVFSIFLFLHKEHYDQNSLYYKIYFRLHQILYLLLFVGVIIAVKETMHIEINFRFTKAGLIIGGLAITFYFFNTYRSIRLITFVCAVLLVRIMFNWFFIEERHQGDRAAICRDQAIDLGKTYKDLPINIYKNSNIDLTSSVYILRERGQVTRRSDEIQVRGITIFDPVRNELPSNAIIRDSICVREGQQTLYLIQSK